MTKVKAFLKKWILNNIGFKILALVFAFILWLVIMNTTDSEMTRTITNIPVTIENESVILDGTHVYTVTSGESTSVVITGKRSIVNTLSAADFSATANFEELSITNAVPITVELRGEKARYANSLIINQKTMSMVIHLEDVKEETFDVQVISTGEPPENLIIEDASTVPAMVTMRAPESVINSVASINAYIDYSQITGDTMVSVDPVIVDHDGKIIEQNQDISLDYEKININVITKTKKLVPVEIIPLGSPDPKYTLNGISYSKNGVTIKGDAESVGMIDVINLPSELLNIEGAKEDVTTTVNLTMYLPQGVTLFGDTESITVTASISPKDKDAGKEEKETPAENEGDQQNF